MKYYWIIEGGWEETAFFGRSKGVDYCYIEKEFRTNAEGNKNYDKALRAYEKLSRSRDTYYRMKLMKRRMWGRFRDV